MRITQMNVLEGVKPPFGYGFAWWNYDTATATYLPVPFNAIAGLVRKLYFQMAGGVRDRQLSEARNEGFKRGCETEHLIHEDECFCKRGGGFERRKREQRTAYCEGYEKGVKDQLDHVVKLAMERTGTKP